MKNRPKSVPIIAWYLIIMAFITLLGFVLASLNPKYPEIIRKSLIPVSELYVMLFAGIFIPVISGVGLLKGRGWSRFLILTWDMAMIIITLTTSPIKINITYNPNLIELVLISFFLFRPKANEYFKNEKDKMLEKDIKKASTVFK